VNCVDKGEGRGIDAQCVDAFGEFGRIDGDVSAAVEGIGTGDGESEQILDATGVGSAALVELAGPMQN